MGSIRQKLRAPRRPGAQRTIFYICNHLLRLLAGVHLSYSKIGEVIESKLHLGLLPFRAAAQNSICLTKLTPFEGLGKLEMKLGFLRAKWH